MADQAGAEARGPIALGEEMSSSRSQYALSRSEMLSGLANRFVFSRLYILLYLGMAGLSFTTVVLSLLSDCPSFAFYILEIIINSAMIAEVGIRLVAFGRSFWKSHWNTLDLVIALVSVMTILFIFAQGCAAKGEETFDTLLLVARNLLQFGRLALIFRRSGKSVFSRVPAIDLEAARNTSLSLDLDMDDEEAQDAERFLRTPRSPKTPSAEPSLAKPASGQAQPFMLSQEGDSDDET